MMTEWYTNLIATPLWVVGLICIWFVLIRYAAKILRLDFLLLFPGTALHELAHLMVGALTGAKPTNVSLIPKFDPAKQVWTLGSVEFSRIRFWNGPLIGLAPLLLLLPATHCIKIAQHTGLTGRYGQMMLASYFATTFLWSARPSLQDLRIAGRGVLIWIMLAALIKLAWPGFQ